MSSSIATATHGYVYPDPTAMKYMLIDEVDTMAGHRQCGSAKTMLKRVFEIAREHGCDEAWTGTKYDRPPAVVL